MKTTVNLKIADTIIQMQSKFGFEPLTHTPKKAPLFKAGMKWDVKVLPQEIPVLQNGMWGYAMVREKLFS